MVPDDKKMKRNIGCIEIRENVIVRAIVKLMKCNIVCIATK